MNLLSIIAFVTLFELDRFLGSSDWLLMHATNSNRVCFGSEVGTGRVSGKFFALGFQACGVAR